ncbi:TonB-dependent receptor [Avibacterium sp. 20-126]|uniref:TonB-dependent receptor n=1 Tax=Avibacterium sp. 20-126 TaxID=2911524 RepID=UPI00218C82B2|nr:TonB-dependent receptor [Avibacterium sp. 20-126]
MQSFEFHKISLFLIAAASTMPSNAEQNGENSQQLAPILVETTISPTAVPDHYLHTQHKITEQQLKQNYSTAIGSVVDKTSGVQSSSFGPNASRPIIRGLSGQRVTVLQNNMPINDLAIVSGNLATSVDPLNAKEIEINKGSASILYGGRSLGGAVNVLDNSIPNKIAHQKISGQVTINKGINAPNQGLFQLNLSNNEHWAGHISGSISKISSVKIPHRTKSSVCYDKSYLQSRTDLQRQCQVSIPVLTTINPAYFKYISQYYLDNYQDTSLGLTEEDKYTNNRGNVFVQNPPNPLYVPNSPYYAEKFGEMKEYRTYPHGKIPNSHSQTRTFTLGTSYISDFGYSGIAWHYYDADYGVPGFAYLNTQTIDGYAPVNVKNKTHRLDWRTHWKTPFTGIDAIDLQVNYQQAKDNEYLGDVLSNGFQSKNYSYRLYASHQPLFGRLIGTIGTDFSHQHVQPNGEDAYLPHLTRKSYSVYGIETLDLSPFMLEAGHRIEKVRYKLGENVAGTARGIGGYYAKDREFYLQNSHLALQFNPTDNSYLRIQRTFAERALEMNELYANNNHYALLIEENGDARLAKEKSKTWEFSLGYSPDPFDISLNWYQTKFDHFTYLGYTGVARNGLMVKEWRQTPFTLTGWELDLTYTMETAHFGTWYWHTFYDQVKQKLPHRLTGLGNYLPNLPSSRFGADLNIEYDRWKGFISAIHYKTQKNVSNEIDEKLSVPSFTLVDLGISYTYPWKQTEIELYLNVNNMTNREARSNTSSLKFLAPLAGRNASLGLNIKF